MLLTADLALLSLACRPKQRPDSQLGERDKLLGERVSRLNDLAREETEVDRLAVSSTEPIIYERKKLIK